MSSYLHSKLAYALLCKSCIFPSSQPATSFLLTKFSSFLFLFWQLMSNWSFPFSFRRIKRHSRGRTQSNCDFAEENRNYWRRISDKHWKEEWILCSSSSVTSMTACNYSNIQALWWPPPTSSAASPPGCSLRDMNSTFPEQCHLKKIHPLHTIQQKYWRNKRCMTCSLFYFNYTWRITVAFKWSTWIE